MALLFDRPFREFSSDREDIHSLLFSPAIFEIKSIKERGATRIDITSDYPITVEVAEAKNPDRIILDFPGTILKAPSKFHVVQASNESISSVALSQFKLDPPSVRVVLTLNEPAEYAVHFSGDGKTASVSVANAKIARKPIGPKKYSVLKDKIIIVDAGHGGRDPGAIGYSGTHEKDATLLLAKKISETLENAGATVFLTRDRDISPDMSEIARFANNNQADIFIAVHYNSFLWPGIAGTETYYYTPQSRLLAKIIHKNLVRGIKRKNRGIKRVMYYTIHHTTMPSVLIEPGYLTHPKEEKLAFNPSFQREVSFDILKGVVEYFTVVKNMRRK
jgi:N-acetylmuramoyl-L-alanine amidase